MDKIDIQVKKNSKGDLIEGPFFVTEIDYDSIVDLQSKPDDENRPSWLIQKCLVNEDGENIFKPQQVKLIKQRLKGAHYMALLMACNGINEFDKISEVGEKYSKN